MVDPPTNAAAQSGDEARTYFDALPDAVLIADDARRYVDANRAACVLLGMERRDLIGRRIDDLARPEERPLLAAAWEDFLNKRVQRAEFSLYLSNGRVVPVEYHAVAHVTPGRHVSVLRPRARSAEDAPDGAESRALLREVEQMRQLVAQEGGLLEAIIDQSPHGIIVSDPQGQLTLQNRAGTRIWAGGASATSVEGWGKYRAYHPDGRPFAPSDWSMARCLAHRQTVPAEEIRFQRFDDTYGVLLGSSAPIAGRDGTLLGAVSVFADITHLRRRDSADRILAKAGAALAEPLAAQEALRRVAQACVPDLGDWCIVDLISDDGAEFQFGVAHANPAHEGLVRELRDRYPLKDDVENIVWSVLRSRRARLGSHLSDPLVHSSSPTHDHVRLVASLDPRSYMVVPLVARGRTLGAITVVSAQRAYDAADLEVAEELGRRTALFVDNLRLYAQAQAAVRTREDLLAIVSHDLRNHLSPISTAASLLLKRTPDDPSARRPLEAIQRSAGRMNHLIGALLDAASIESGKFSIASKACDLAAVIEEAVNEMRDVAARQSVRVECNVVEIRALELECDNERIFQVLSNLLSNAVKFTPRDGKIIVNAAIRDLNVTVSVIDEGPGISAEDQQHLFERYWSRSRPGTSGTGLGLYISKGIVEAHGGQLWVNTGSGAGSAFSFSLPINHQGRKAATGGPTIGAAQGGGVGG